VKAEWDLFDYAEQMKFWDQVPPPMISMAMVARSHGAKFGSGRSTAPVTSAPAEQASPDALQAFLGQSHPLPYRQPQRGLTVN
jgi:hypothetical protein